MRFMHLSDLHLGKTLSGYSLLKDQRYILGQILEITGRQKPDAILIAGDIFDRSAPSAETVALMDDFLTQLSAYEIPILMIAGNHDSPERVAYGGRIMKKNGIHLSPVYDKSGRILSVTIPDADGDVCFWLMPFLRPADVRLAFPDAKFKTASEALQTVVDAMELDPGKRNVLLAHQFVTGARLSDSEENYCGTAEQISRDVFEPFDYTALGHLHNPQNVGSVRVRYCGTPLKYSIKEADSVKSVTFVELREKGTEPVITTVPLHPERELKILRGSFAELIQGTDANFVHIVLTDETDVPDAMGKLRQRYPFILGLDYEYRKPFEVSALDMQTGKIGQNPEALFSTFFEQVMSHGMNQEQEQIIQELIQEIWEEENE